MAAASVRVVPAALAPRASRSHQLTTARCASAARGGPPSTSAAVSSSSATSKSARLGSLTARKALAGGSGGAAALLASPTTRAAAVSLGGRSSSLRGRSRSLQVRPAKQQSFRGAGTPEPPPDDLMCDGPKSKTKLSSPTTIPEPLTKATKEGPRGGG